MQQGRQAIEVMVAPSQHTKSMGKQVVMFLCKPKDRTRNAEDMLCPSPKP